VTRALGQKKIAATAYAFAANSFSDLIADKAMWSSFDWKKPKASKAWTLGGWEKVKADAEVNASVGFDGQLLFATRQVELNGVVLNASLIRVEDKEIIVTPYERLELKDKVQSFEHCKKIEEWLTKNFGKPRMIVDASYIWDPPAPWKKKDHFDLKEEWYLGQTRVFLECKGVKGIQDEGDSGPSDFKFNFEDKTYDVDLRPLTGITCKYSGIKKGTKTEGEDFFFVDDIYERICNDKLVPFAGDLAGQIRSRSYVMIWAIIGARDAKKEAYA
jgi:hypothetical protein